MQSTSVKNTSAAPVLKKYWAAVRHYPFLAGSVVFVVLCAQSAEIIGPLVLKHFIDLLVKNANTPLLNSEILFSLILYAGFLFLTWLFYRIQMIQQMKLDAQVQSDLFNSAFDNLIFHGYDFFINNFAGTLTRRVTRYARSYQQVFQNIVMGILPTVFFAVGVISILFVKNVWLGAALAIWSILFLIIQFLLTKWRYEYKLLRSEQDSRLTGAISDSVGNHSAILLFAGEEKEKKRIAGVVRDWYNATVRAWAADTWNYAIQGFLSRSIQVALLGGALYLWLQGALSVGDVVLVQVYMIGLIDRISNVGSNMRQLYDAYSEANEMIEIMAQPHSITDIPGAKDLIVTDGRVSFDNVIFSFSDDRTVLKNFSLDVSGKEKIAFVGSSGAGKTTLTKLLLRLYDVTEGSIQIDGQDISSVTQESLRRSVSFVPQDPVLFHRTLRENIAYGVESATDEEVIEAARKAHCHEFISTLPLGYDTYVGERGVKLSGGERQRVAIARAILKNAPILVLDEATASLDSESEHLIQEALRTLMQGKTVIVIAHRLSTIMNMDRIIVMEHGRIVDQGTHEDLLKRQGIYAKLWNIQAGGFIGDDSED